MKKTILFLAVLAFLSINSVAQTGTLKSFQKISQTQGNFPLTLHDNGEFGSALTSIGDLNKDGINDMAISSLNYPNTPSIYVTFMNKNGTVKSVTEITAGKSGLPSNLSSTYNMQNFAYSIDTIGDLDNDGVVDIVVGMPYSSGSGYVFILFMKMDGTVKSYMVIGQGMNGFNDNLSNTSFGCSVSGIGDFNNDGIPDIAIGGYKKDNYCGAIWILFMNNDGTVKSYLRYDKNTTVLSSFLGKSTKYKDWFGSSIACIGDFDNNGKNDLIIGAMARYNTGSVFILYLNPDNSIKSLKELYPGVTNFPDTIIKPIFFGNSVAVIGDINNDKIQDIAISDMAFGYNPTEKGAVWIIMPDSQFNVKSYQRISDSVVNFNNQLNNNDRFGRSVTGLGDFNGDGIVDIAVGSSGDDDGGSGRGAVYLLYLNGTPSITATLNLTPKQISLSYTANSTYTFKIKSNANWNVNNSASWLNLDKSTGSFNDSIKVTATANTSTSPRTASVVVTVTGISPDTVYVTQQGKPNAIEEQENNYNIYPNPATDKIYINSSIRQTLKMQVFNTVGQCVLQRELNTLTNVIDISSLTRGIYILKLTNPNGTYEKKIIKE